MRTAKDQGESKEIGRDTDSQLNSISSASFKNRRLHRKAKLQQVSSGVERKMTSKSRMKDLAKTKKMLR